MATYTAVLLDKDGFETARDEIDTIKDARRHAKYLLSDAYAHAVESTHDEMGTQKVEIRNQDGECLWDAFL